MNNNLETKDNTTLMQTLSKNEMGPMRTAEMLHPGKDEWRQRLMITLDLWSLEEGALTLVQFCTTYGIPYSSLMRWKNDHEDLKFILEEVKRRLGDRRWRMAFLKQASESLALRGLHKYLPEWEEINRYHADLKKAEEVQSGIQIVYLPQVPDTGRVKPRKDKKNVEEQASLKSTPRDAQVTGAGAHEDNEVLVQNFNEIQDLVKMDKVDDWHHLQAVGKEESDRLIHRT